MNAFVIEHSLHVTLQTLPTTVEVYLLDPLSTLFRSHIGCKTGKNYAVSPQVRRRCLGEQRMRRFSTMAASLAVPRACHGGSVINDCNPLHSSVEFSCTRHHDVQRPSAWNTDAVSAQCICFCSNINCCSLLGIHGLKAILAIVTTVVHMSS